MTVWILSSSVLIAAVAALRAALKGKIAPWLQYALWLLVLVRLLVPVSLTASRISVANLLPQEEPQAAVLKPAAQPSFDFEDLPGTAHGNISIAPAASSAPAAEMPEPVAAPEETMDWGRLLQSVWIAGALLVGLALLGSNLTFYLRLERSRRMLHTDLPLPVYASGGLPSPCLFGLLRPAVYVPTAYVEDEQAMSHILAHEWSHYKQGDHIWSLLRSLCVALHWYNPLVWLAAVLSRQDAELCCDAAAIRRLGEGQRLPYGRTLLSLVTAKPRPADLLSCATTMRSGKRSLRHRISYIANKPKMLAVTAAAVLLAAAVAVGCTFTGASNSTGNVTAIEADSAAISLYYTDVEIQLSETETAQLLALYNSQQITETGQSVDTPSRLTVRFQKDGQETAVWYVGRDGVCAADGLGNYIWENADYETMAELFWNGFAPNGGWFFDASHGIASPKLTSTQLQEILQICRSMVLTPTSNEPDWASRVQIMLWDDLRTILSFCIDSKGEVMLLDSDLSWHFYTCENGAALYQQLLDMKSAVLQQIPMLEIVWDYIASQVEAVQETYGYTVLDVKLTSMKSAASVKTSEEAYHEEYSACILGYRMQLANPETVVLPDGMEMTEDGWLTETCSLGQPVLILRSQDDQFTYVGATYTGIVEAEFNGDYEQAALSIAAQAAQLTARQLFEILYANGPYGSLDAYLGKAFLSGLRYDTDSETLLLPEGAYDGWTIRIRGTIPMDETSYMTYHDDFNYEEAASAGGHSRSIALNGFHSAELELLCWDENGEVLYDGFKDLMTLLPDRPASLDQEALQAALQALFDGGGLQMSMVVDGDEVYGGFLLTDESYMNRLLTIFRGYLWTPAEAGTAELLAEADYYIDLSAGDGSGFFRFYAGSDLVEYDPGSGETACYQVTGGKESITVAVLMEYDTQEAICALPTAVSE